MHGDFDAVFKVIAYSFGFGFLFGIFSYIIFKEVLSWFKG